VDALSHSRPGLAEPELTDTAYALWSGAHGVATLWLDGPLRAMSPSMDIAAFMRRAAAQFAASDPTEPPPKAG
jgi:hypothetical protein